MLLKILMDPPLDCEIPAVVLCLGSYFSKFGIAGEHEPRKILATPFLEQTETVLLESEWIKVLTDFLRDIFVETLLVNPSERRVIVCENFLSPFPFKEALSYVLFHRLEVPSICFIPDLVSPLYACGLSTGLVIDIGHTSCRILPVAYGLPLYNRVEIISVGGKNIDIALKKSLIDYCSSENEVNMISDMSAEQLSDLKTRACFAHPRPDQDLSWNQLGNYSIYKSNLGHDFNIKFESRWQPCEVLFGCGDGNDPEVSIQAGIMRCLENCAVDIRSKLLQTILVCGGTAEMPGILHRISSELGLSLFNSKILGNIDIGKIAFSSPNFSPLRLQWVGASIYGRLYGAQDISRDDYLNGEELPDWTVIPHKYLDSKSNT